MSNDILEGTDEEVGKALKDLRGNRYLTIGQKIGEFSWAEIWMFESGKRLPNLKQLIRLCVLYKVSEAQKERILALYGERRMAQDLVDEFHRASMVI